MSELYSFFFFSSRRRHTRCSRDWSSDVCSSDLILTPNEARKRVGEELRPEPEADQLGVISGTGFIPVGVAPATAGLMVDEKGVIRPHPVTPTAPPPKPATNGAGGHNATRGGTPVSQEAGGGRSTGRNTGVDN